jgi:pimeloyl-ACP methyl ester carboxylesterase
VAPTQRGYSPGARPGGVRSYRLDELAADALAIADQLGAPRVHLVGHDWGGAIGWTIGAQQPDRLASLTVVSTPHPAAMARSMLGAQALRSSYIGLFRTPLVAEAVLGAGGNAVLRRGLQAGGLDADHATAYATALREPGALTAALNWYRAPQVRMMLRTGAVSVPTLYVWGANDPALGPAAARRTARHVSGPYRFEVLPDAGHWIPEQHGARLAELLLEHLTSTPAN